MEMKWKLVAVGIVLLGGILILGIWSAATATASARSEYRYEVLLSTDKPVNNLTLILPFPQGPHTEELISAVLFRNFSGGEENWRCMLLENRKALMLKLEVPHLDPYPLQTPVPLSEMQERRQENQEQQDSRYVPPFTITRETSHSIATTDPRGSEPLLSLKENATPVTCPSPVPQQSLIRCFTEKTVLYADYSADPGTQLSVIVTFSGSNSHWWLGWSSDSYQEELIASFSVERQGWQEVDLRRVQGVG
ncbi:MAG: hypothetical protein LUQ40_03105 [Methanomicrobiales archaeon]|nr:hypothetical protein [Methanomicrobiales archaeon]